MVPMSSFKRFLLYIQNTQYKCTPSAHGSAAIIHKCRSTIPCSCYIYVTFCSLDSTVQMHVSSQYTTDTVLLPSPTTVPSVFTSFIYSTAATDIITRHIVYSNGYITLCFNISYNWRYRPNVISVSLTKGSKLGLGQLEDWIFCVSLASRTCNVWRNMLSRIWQRMGRHFKGSVDMLTIK